MHLAPIRPSDGENWPFSSQIDGRAVGNSPMSPDTQKRPSGSQLAKINAALSALGISYEEAEALALRKRGAQAAPEGVKVTPSLDAFLRERMKAGIRSASVRWFSTRLGPLHSRLGQRQVASLSRADLREVLNRMEVSDSTRNNYARAWRAWWRWLMKLDDTPARSDITLGLAPIARKVERDGAEILPVADVERILANIRPEYRSAAAVLFFAGVRPQEIWGTDKKPLLWQHILVSERILRVPADIAKTRKARTLEGLPDALWDWLKPGAPSEPICPAQSQYLIRHIQQSGGFYQLGEGRHGRWQKVRPWPHDATRHSFATYALALTSDAARVALWLGHEGNTTMLHRHYRGLATKAEAERYFAIRPPITIPAPILLPTA